jgi:hypothetical protein
MSLLGATGDGPTTLQNAGSFAAIGDVAGSGATLAHAGTIRRR